MSRALSSLLACAGISLVLICWALSNPPGAMSDEPDQYLKAVAAGHGEIRGERLTPEQAQPMDYWLPGLQSTLVGFPDFAALARGYEIPSHLQPAPMGCTVEYWTGAADCLYQPGPASAAGPPTVHVVSSVGSYQPYVFIPAGLVMRLAKGPDAALYLGRLTFVVLELILVCGAIVVALGARRSPALVGIVLAVPPTAVLCMGSLSSSGPEVASAIGWWTALLAVSEPTGERMGAHRRLAWGLLALSGLVLGFTRITGPIWIILSLLVALVLRGARPAWRLLRTGGSAAVVAVGATALGVVLCVVWQKTQQPTIPLTFTAFDPTRLPAIVVGMVSRAIGVYGWGEGQPPAWVMSLWMVVVAGLFLAAWLRSRPRRRARGALVFMLALCPVFIGVFLVLERNAGAVQGRWFLGLLVGMPILSGWLAGEPAENAHIRTESTFSVVCLVLAAAALGAAWWMNAHRYAVGTEGPLWFLGSNQWRPPLHWGVWVVAESLGLLLIVGAAAVPLRANRQALAAAAA